MPTNHSLTNGNHSAPPVKSENTTAIVSDSDSDLSEVIDIPSAPPQFGDGGERPEEDEEDEDMSDADVSPEDDAVGSDDPDYDMVTPPLQNGGSVRDARSTSQESPQQRKRKTGGVDHDDFMLNDPELYGLRRSVSRHRSQWLTPADHTLQGRPRPIRQIV